MKALYTYILSLCFLLLNGASPLQAKTTVQDYHTFAFTTTQHDLDTELSNFGIEHNDHLEFKSLSGTIEQQLDKIEITESEDQEEETIHYRKLLDIDSYIATSSCVHTFGFFQHWKTARLTLTKHKTPFTSYKSFSIRFCVYRL